MKALRGLVLVMLVGLAACASAMQLTGAVFGQPGNELRISSGGPAATVEIFSPAGVGRATLQAVSIALPQRILLRFHLRGLEELRLAYGQLEVVAALNSSSAGVRQSLRRDGVEQPLAEGDPQWLPIRLVPEGPAAAAIPLTAGVIEVELPKAFFQSGEKSFQLQWVDFFR